MATSRRIFPALALGLLMWCICLAANVPSQASWGQTEPPLAPVSHVPGVACVALQPLGEVDEDSLTAVTTALTNLYGFEVRLLEPVDLPDSAWYEPRERYRAELLLEALTPLRPTDCERILGITTRDISTTNGEHEDWGILGLANLGGHEAVISRYRTRRRLAEVSADERLARVAMHEIGHTLGLPHCPTEGCYLNDANGSVLTVDGDTHLCATCRTAVGWVE